MWGYSLSNLLTPWARSRASGEQSSPRRRFVACTESASGKWHRSIWSYLRWREEACSHETRSTLHLLPSHSQALSSSSPSLSFCNLKVACSSLPLSNLQISFSLTSAQTSLARDEWTRRRKQSARWYPRRRIAPMPLNLVQFFPRIFRAQSSFLSWSSSSPSLLLPWARHSSESLSKTKPGILASWIREDRSCWLQYLSSCKAPQVRVGEVSLCKLLPVGSTWWTRTPPLLNPGSPRNLLLSCHGLSGLYTCIHHT